MEKLKCEWRHPSLNMRLKSPIYNLTDEPPFNLETYDRIVGKFVSRDASVLFEILPQVLML